MKKIIALGGSNSKNSINKRLAVYTANKIENTETVVLDLNDFELPIYGVDLETENGIPSDAQKLFDQIKSADAIVLSLAEHNGSYSAAFKNAFDWMSRIESKVWSQIPMVLMATSPGARGGQTVLASALASFPHMGGNIVGEFSLPSFYDNFSEDGITNPELKEVLNKQINKLEKAI